MYIDHAKQPQNTIFYEIPQGMADCGRIDAKEILNGIIWNNQTV